MAARSASARGWSAGARPLRRAASAGAAPGQTTPRGFVLRPAGSAPRAAGSSRTTAAAIALKRRGNAAYKAGDFAQAARRYSDALVEDPQSHTLYANRSAAYLKLKRLSASLEDAETSLTMRADFAGGYLRKGEAMRALARWEDAQAAFRAGLKIEPKNRALQAALASVPGISLTSNIPGGAPKRAGETDNTLPTDLPERLKALFERSDRNKDGQLTRSELIHSLRKDGALVEQLGLPANVRDAHRAQFEELFQAMDANDDKVIELEEFVTYFLGAAKAATVSGVAAANLARAAAEDETLRALFDEIDADGNGTLDRHEIGRMAKVLGMPLSSNQLDSAMVQMDTDHSGGVDYEEFKAWHDVLTGKVQRKMMITNKKRTSFLTEGMGAQRLDGERQKKAVAVQQGLGSTVTKSNTIYDRMVELGALGEKQDATDDGPDHHHLTSDHTSQFQRLQGLAAKANAAMEKKLLRKVVLRMLKRQSREKKKGDVSPLSKLIDEVVEGKEELQAEPAAPPLDEKGFVSSRTASVKGAITSLGNMAISEDMDFHALFHEIDADKNGYIDKMELRAVLWVLWPQAADEKIIDQVYELIDDDNSGKIVEAEFVPKMEQLTKEFREEKQAFREQRRAAKRAEQEERRKRERYMERPEIPYRELDIDRRWFSLLRLCRYGFAEPVADDPQARMERAEKKAEEIRIRKLFVELDTDGSGMVEKNEVALLGEHLFGEVMTPAQLDLAMDEMDPDGSGEISFEEFHRWYSSEGDFRRKALEEERQNKKQNLRIIFSDVDADGTGLIDADEVKRLARTLFDTDLSPLELKRAMKEMDPDGSGEVDFDEFSLWYFGEGEFRKKAELEQKRRAAEAAKRKKEEGEEAIRQNKLLWLRGMFEKVDTSGDGSIDKDEVKFLIEEVFGTEMGPQQLDACMLEIDPDGSGEVDFIEFANWCNREVPTQRLDEMYSWWVVQRQALLGAAGSLNSAMSKLLRRWFNEADTDGGGCLDAAEITKLASSLLGRHISKGEAIQMMEEMDPIVPCGVCSATGKGADGYACPECDGKGRTGGDGEVDFIEFERWYFAQELKKPPQ